MDGKRLLAADPSSTHNCSLSFLFFHNLYNRVIHFTVRVGLRDLSGGVLLVFYLCFFSLLQLFQFLKGKGQYDALNLLARIDVEMSLMYNQKQTCRSEPQRRFPERNINRSQASESAEQCRNNNYNSSEEGRHCL